MSGSYLSQRKVAELLAAGRLDLDVAGGAYALAEVTGYDRKTLDRCVRVKGVGEDGRQQSLNVLMMAGIILFSDGQATRTLEQLCLLAGRVAVPAPDECRVGHGHGAMCAVTQEFSDLVKALSQALKDDGQISAGEIINQDLRGKLQALVRICMTLDKRFEARVEGWE
ncbi:MAG: hypothetical protein OIF56_15070 [Cohaesibacter sp.]|nr:hypothetical protein [Cohaesibacter sp.]